MPTSEELQKLKYTDMAFSESMRLFPPTWTMGRKALDDFHLGPYFLPTATTVLMSQWVMHRDARDFPDPLRFEPERFAPENKREHLRFSYFPFGAGLRQCIGESFARMEGALLLPRWRKAGSCDLFPATRSSPHRSYSAAKVRYAHVPQTQECAITASRYRLISSANALRRGRGCIATRRREADSARPTDPANQPPTNTKTKQIEQVPYARRSVRTPLRIFAQSDSRRVER